MSVDRLHIIREAAESLRERPRSLGKAAAPRPTYGVLISSKEAAQKALTAAAGDWIAQRRQHLDSAISFLNRHGLFVQIVDRQARVRQYRISGKRETCLAEDVIAIAIQHGMQAERDRGED